MDSQMLLSTEVQKARQTRIRPHAEECQLQSGQWRQLRCSLLSEKRHSPRCVTLREAERTRRVSRYHPCLLRGSPRPRHHQPPLALFFCRGQRPDAAVTHHPISAVSALGPCACRLTSPLAPERASSRGFSPHLAPCSLGAGEFRAPRKDASASEGPLRKETASAAQGPRSDRHYLRLRQRLTSSSLSGRRGFGLLPWSALS